MKNIFAQLLLVRSEFTNSIQGAAEVIDVEVDEVSKMEEYDVLLPTACNLATGLAVPIPTLPSEIILIASALLTLNTI